MKRLLSSIYLIGFISFAQINQTLIWNTNQENVFLNYETNLIIKSSANVNFVGEIEAESIVLKSEDGYSITLKNWESIYARGTGNGVMIKPIKDSKGEAPTNRVKTVADKSETETKQYIKIYNTMGTLVYETNCNSTAVCEIEIEKLPKGIYFMVSTSSTNEITKTKFIKE